MYATVEDLVAAFGQDEVIALTNRDGTDTVGADVALEALARASSEADSYLSVRYPVPVLTVDPALKDAVCQIARYRLTGAEVSETDPIQARYDRAIKWLERIAKGEANLPGMQDPADTAGSVEFSTGRRVFNRSAGVSDD